MDGFTTAGCILVGLIVDTLFMGFLLRVRKGRLEQSASWIETDLGRYLIDRKKGVFKATAASGKAQSIPLNQLDGISLRRHEKASTMLETLTGFSIFDFSQRYRDTVAWYTVSVSSSQNGVSVPIFVAGQYCPREFFIEQYVIGLQQRVLEAMHLLRSVDKVSRDALDQTRAAFAAAGVELRMTH